MRSFTLDWNCVIALENVEPQGESVSLLVDAHRARRADVALLATSASESLRNKTFPGSYKDFEERVQRAGLSDLPVLLTPAVVSLTFIERSYIVDQSDYSGLRDRIWSLLFPTISQEAPLTWEHDPEEELYSSSLSRWRNAWCDVHSLITHMDHGRDVFVTSNTKHFQKHQEQLRNLGVDRIATPRESLDLF